MAVFVEGKEVKNFPPGCFLKLFASSIALLGWLGHAEGFKAALKVGGEIVVYDWNDFVLKAG